MPDFNVTVSGNLPVDEATPLRVVTVAVRAASRAGAAYHHDKHIPQHFKSGAASKYGYKRRSASWQAFKRRVGASSLPLVFSGATAQEITGERKITATSTRGATLRMRAALPGLTSGRFRLKRGQQRLSGHQERQLARVEEIKAITADELNAIARAEEKAYIASVQAQMKTVSRRTIATL